VAGLRGAFFDTSVLVAGIIVPTLLRRAARDHRNRRHFTSLLRHGISSNAAQDADAPEETTLTFK